MAENRYCDIEAFLDTIPQYAGESGVVRAGALLEELGHPEKTLKIIHVAGSNGKGSVCAYLNRILIQHGFRTGLFTSPHLVDVRERIRIDNEMVSKSDFVQAFDRVHSAEKRLQKKNITLAYFDWLFGMALLLFVQKLILNCCMRLPWLHSRKNRQNMWFWKPDLAGGSMPPMQYKIRCCP